MGDFDNGATGDVETVMEPEGYFADLPADETEEVTQDPAAQGAEEQTAEAEGAKKETYQLPDEKVRIFPDAELLKFAQARFPKLVPLFNDANSQEGIREILNSKLHTELYVAQLKREREEAAEKEETEEQPTETVQAKTPTQEELTKEITSFVDRITDPDVAKTFWSQINEASAKALGPKGDGVGGDGGVAFVKTVSSGMVNLMRDAVPALLAGGFLDNYLQGYMAANYEGLGEAHVTNMQQRTWNELKTSDPAYANLPEYGTPEWIAAHEKAAEMVPGIENAIFPGKDGKPLSPVAQFRAKAMIAAKLIAGTATKTDVARAEMAVETGKREQAQSAQRKQNANLGAGASRGKITQGARPQGIDAARSAAIQRMKRDENPFDGLRPQQ